LEAEKLGNDLNDRSFEAGKLGGLEVWKLSNTSKG
jgi:hypothetical protein